MGTQTIPATPSPSLAHLRAQKAKLLGYPNFAAWKIEDQMAKSPEAALKFMDAIVPAASADK